MMGKLEDLLVDENQINEDLLFEALAPYIRVGKTTNTIILKPEFEKLAVKKKLLVYLLGRKVLFAMGKVEEESVGPSEISRNTGIKEGSVFPSLRELDQAGLVDVKNGKYCIPNHNVLKIKEVLK